MIKSDSKQFQSQARRIATKARNAFRELRTSPSDKRNEIICRMADLLNQEENVNNILTANELDLEKANENDLKSSLKERLTLNRDRINKISTALNEISDFPDPVGEIINETVLKNGIKMIKKRVPLGVIFTVFESRPNVTVDIGALCIKSGNAVILRGGKEAIHTNRALFSLFRQALEETNLPAESIQLIDNPDRAFMVALLQVDDMIDIVVPRGGEGLIKFVTEHSRIPVVKHDKGVCNLFVDKSADLEKAIPVAINSKLKRPALCNAIENLLIHAEYKDANELLKNLKNSGARLRGTARESDIFSDIEIITDLEEEYSTEYLDNRLAVKMVENVTEAVEFIQRFGSGHSEGILAETSETIQYFITAIDSAAIFVNCSTYFHDGGQMGMGAEVGISTGRLHVRGPMGIRDLTTTTYILNGEGQVRE